MSSTPSDSELKVTFYPPLHLRRRIWILEILRRDNVSSVRPYTLRYIHTSNINAQIIDIGCGEGSLLNVLCQPAPWLSPPNTNSCISTINQQSDQPRSLISSNDEIKNLHPTHVVGLDISSPDLEFASQVTAPTPLASHNGIRWEPLDVKIWKGGLESFNPEFVDVECIVSSEV
jgi:hypothetical protein